jgi:hypothetical protein
VLALITSIEILLEGDVVLIRGPARAQARNAKVTEIAASAFMTQMSPPPEPMHGVHTNAIRCPSADHEGSDPSTICATPEPSGLIVETIPPSSNAIRPF